MCVCVFTSKHSVDRGVCSQTRLPSFMEYPSVGKVLWQKEASVGNNQRIGIKIMKT